MNKTHLYRELSAKYTNIVYFCLFLCVFMACFLPPIKGFHDNLIKPKWFFTELITIITFIILLLHFYVSRLFTESKSYEVTIKEELSKAIVCISFLEVIYVICNIICNHQEIIKGTFENPSGLAFCLSALLPFHFYLFIIYKKNKSIRNLIIALFLITISIILLTQSRTGWIYITLFLMIVTNKIKVFDKIIRIPIYIIITIVLSILVCKFKSNSSSGRLFILERSWELIKENPICGHGPGGFIQNYMLKQAEFFKTNYNNHYAWLADEIQHPLNEFILSWVEFGIGGILIHIGIFIILFILLRKDKDYFSFSLNLSLLSLFIFSIFSYPMVYPLFWIILILCSFTAFKNKIANTYNSRFIKYKSPITFICIGVLLLRLIFLIYSFKFENAWYNIYQKSLRGHSKEVMPYYDKLYSHFHSNVYFLYNYASEQFYAERNDSALNTAKECLSKWPSYNLSLLMGDICRNSNKFNESITFYEQAHYMCPIRFAPLEGLYYSYKQLGIDSKTDSIADIIAHKTIKINSGEIQRIKKEILDDIQQ